MTKNPNILHRRICQHPNILSQHPGIICQYPNILMVCDRIPPPPPNSPCPDLCKKVIVLLVLSFCYSLVRLFFFLSFLRLFSHSRVRLLSRSLIPSFACFLVFLFSRSFIPSFRCSLFLLFSCSLVL